jgi:hypothetical protein
VSVFRGYHSCMAAKVDIPTLLATCTMVLFSYIYLLIAIANNFTIWIWLLCCRTFCPRLLALLPSGLEETRA